MSDKVRKKREGKNLFHKLSSALKNGSYATRLSFFFMGFAIFSSGFFTALNDGVTSAVISFLRTLVFQSAL